MMETPVVEIRPAMAGVCLPWPLPLLITTCAGSGGERFDFGLRLDEAGGLRLLTDAQASAQLIVMSVKPMPSMCARSLPRGGSYHLISS